MTIAQGISKKTVVKKQTGLGVPAVGAGGQVLRRRTSVFQLMRDTYKSDEIVSHMQSTGASFGLRKIQGKISGLLSAGTWKLFWATMLRKDFVVGVNTTALTTVASNAGSPGNFTRSAGSYLTDGFKTWDIVRWTGWATTAVAHNNRNFLITALTPTVMTGVFIDNPSTAIVTKAAGDSVTATVVGKKTLAPLTGHTDDLFTVEEWYPDIAQSELFTDNKLVQAAVALPASGNATVDFDFAGLNRTLNVAQQLTTPTAETTTSILTAVNGVLYANGAQVGLITGLNFTAVENVTPDGPVVGSNSSPDLSRGLIEVSGQFVVYFQDQTFTALFTNESALALFCVVLADGTALADFVAYRFTRVKLHGDTPDDGMKGIARTVPFTAEIDINGGAALADDQTIMAVQDSQA